MTILSLAYQRTTRTPRSKRFIEEDRPVIQQLLELLLVCLSCTSKISVMLKYEQPLRQVTEICSKAEVPLLCDILLHYDGLHYEYNRIRDDPKHPLYARQAAERVIKKLNKYYQASDTSVMYHLALCESHFCMFFQFSIS
jgi:hypothetical protein